MVIPHWRVLDHRDELEARGASEGVKFMFLLKSRVSVGYKWL